MPIPKDVQHWVIPNVYSRRLQTWVQEFESDTTRLNWGDRLIVKYECLSAKLLPKGVATFFL